MQKILKNKIPLFLIPRLCCLYIHFIGFTSKIKYVNREHINNLESGNEPIIYALWHNAQFFLLYVKKLRIVNMLISKSKDGDYIAEVGRLFGFKTIRGSSSKGGVRAMVSLIKALKNKETAAITPDGPRGPKNSVQPGIVQLALKTNAWIVPVDVHAKRKKVFKSWDLFEVFYPFNDIAFRFGEPFRLDNQLDDIEVHQKLIQKALMTNRSKLRGDSD